MISPSLWSLPERSDNVAHFLSVALGRHFD
jgi:hypothetical protein